MFPLSFMCTMYGIDLHPSSVMRVSCSFVYMRLWPEGLQVSDLTEREPVFLSDTKNAVAGIYAT